MSKILNYPNEMRTLQNSIYDIKASKHKDISKVINNNKFMAANYRTIERVRHDNLKISLKQNTKTAIKK